MTESPRRAERPGSEPARRHRTRFPSNAIATCGGKVSFHGLQGVATGLGVGLAHLLEVDPTLSLVSGGDSHPYSVQAIIGQTFFETVGKSGRDPTSHLTVIVPPGRDRRTEELSVYGSEYVLTDEEAARYRVADAPESIRAYGERNGALVGQAAQVVVLGAGPMAVFEVVTAMSEGKPVAIAPSTSGLDRLAYDIARHRVTSLEELTAHPAFVEAGPTLRGLFDNNVRDIALAAFKRWATSERVLSRPPWSEALEDAWESLPARARAVYERVDADPLAARRERAARDPVVVDFLLTRLSENRPGQQGQL